MNLTAYSELKFIIYISCFGVYAFVYQATDLQPKEMLLNRVAEISL